MKVTYYAYYLRNLTDNSIEQLDLNKNISKIKTPQRKQSSESIFVKKIVGDVYFFIKTNQLDIIKKINMKSFNVDDITSSLEKDEKLGFASYFILKKGVIGFGSTLLSPKIKEFTDFINIKLKISDSDQEFILEPLTRTVTKADAMKLSFIGKTTLRTQENDGLIGSILAFFGSVKESNIDGLEITIKPKRNQNIKNAIIPIINHMGDELDLIKMRAKEHLSDIAAEIYIADNNVLQSVVDHKKSHAIPSNLENNYQIMEPRIQVMLKSKFSVD